jgi:hypothetical protein
MACPIALSTNTRAVESKEANEERYEARRAENAEAMTLFLLLRAV